MEVFAPYAHALAAMAIFAILTQMLAGMSTRNRSAEDRAECGKPKRNYDNAWYRTERAFANAVESGAPFLAATVSAIMVGSPAFWVNLLAAVFVAARVCMAVVHVGTTNQPARSLCFAVAFLSSLALATVALIGAFTL